MSIFNLIICLAILLSLAKGIQLFRRHCRQRFGGGSSVIAANDNRSGSPGEVHLDHRQATSMSWAGLGLNSRMTFSAFSPSASSRPSIFALLTFS
jgi:hypothetical protein